MGVVGGTRGGGGGVFLAAKEAAEAVFFEGCHDCVAVGWRGRRRRSRNIKGEVNVVGLS